MIKREIEISGKKVPFRSSATIPRLYRAKFKRDIFKDLSKLEKSYKGKTENGEEFQIEDLEISEKFTPALYTLHDGVWEGGSVSMFSPVLKFTLYERFSQESLEVAETMEVNGKRTFGYDVPIVYRRAAD